MQRTFSFLKKLSKIRWNIFKANEEDDKEFLPEFSGSSSRRDKPLLFALNGKDFVFPIYNRIGIDVASIAIKHVRVDKDGSYTETLSTFLNKCLTLDANLDQTGRALIQDAVMSLCDEGVIAIVPVDTIGDPFESTSYDILSMRVGKITQWYPSQIEVELYNELIGEFERITIPKRMAAIVENPLYAVMNSENSTLKRLLEKIALLDVIDKQSGSGKLDIIIQLPFALKGEKRQEQAEKRKAMIDEQLSNSTYGIAYIDSTERVIQLNRPAENNLMAQITYLSELLWSQLGLTQSVFDGTANEETILNYWNRTVEPFIGAITDAMNRRFITKTGWTQGQRILAIRDPFKLVPASQLPEMADMFTRNEIMSGNEFRRVIGLRPSDDPAADKLKNKNIADKSQEQPQPKPFKMEGDNKNDAN